MPKSTLVKNKFLISLFVFLATSVFASMELKYDDDFTENDSVTGYTDKPG